MEIKVRKVDAAVGAKIDELAKKKGISREEYLRKQLTRLAISEDLEAVEDKYENLVSVLADQLEYANEVIELNSTIVEKNNEVMDAVKKLLGSLIDP